MLLIAIFHCRTFVEASNIVGCIQPESERSRKILVVFAVGPAVSERSLF